MHSFPLQLRMMLRRMTGNALMILLLMATTLFLSLYPGFIQSAEEKMVEAGKGITINGWAYFPGDGDFLSLPLALRNATLDTGYIASHVTRSKVQYYSLEEIIAKQGEGETPEEKRTHILGRLKLLSFTISATQGKWFGVNDISADSDLLTMQDQIKWLDGYDASCLKGNEQVCLYPARDGVEPGDTVEILLSHKLGSSKYDRDRLLVSFKVVGTFQWNSADPIAYCPLATLDALVGEREGFEYSMDRFSFVVGKNEAIPQLKDFFVSHALHEDANLRMAIDDRLYEKAMAPLEKNLNLLQGLQYIFYVLVILLGFFLCFLVARRRKPEYAVMRMLGEPSAQVVLKALAEQLILCTIGILLGALIVLLSGLGQVSALTCGSVLLCYSIGSALAVILMVRVDVMEILRDKE